MRPVEKGNAACSASKQIPCHRQQHGRATTVESCRLRLYLPRFGDRLCTGGVDELNARRRAVPVIRLRVRESRPVGHPHQLHTSSLCRDSHTRHRFTDRNQRPSCQNRYLVHRPEIDCSWWRSSDRDRDFPYSGKLRRLPLRSVRGNAQCGLRMASCHATSEFSLSRASFGLLLPRQLSNWQSACFRPEDSDLRADSSSLPMALVRLPTLKARTERGSLCRSLEFEWPRQAATAARSSADVDYGRSVPMAAREALISDHNTSNDTLTNSVKRDSAQEAASSRTSR